MYRWTWVPVFLCLVLHNPTVTDTHTSCMQIFLNNQQQPSGMYNITNNGQQMTVFCDFRDGLGTGYTYIDSGTINSIDIKVLYNENDHAIIRILKSDGGQTESVMRQIVKYQKIFHLSFQYNMDIGYQMPNYNKGMYPYLYLGFLPESEADKKNTQGNNAQGVDSTFDNCGRDGSSYFAFYFNPNNVAAEYDGSATNDLMDNFHKLATAVTVSMPSQYYFDFQIHFGGCGGFATKGAYSGDNIVGIALGLPFVVQCNIECADTAILLSSGFAVGESLKYECPSETELIRGDLLRTCRPTGFYDGTMPLCGACPNDGLVAGEACFYISSETFTFSEAMELCEFHGLRPVEILDGLFELVVENHISDLSKPGKRAKLGEYWLGATDVFSEGEWYWGDAISKTGSKIGDYFTKWAIGRPLDSKLLNCLYLKSLLYTRGYVWIDGSCNEKKHAICMLR